MPLNETPMKIFWVRHWDNPSYQANLQRSEIFIRKQFIAEALYKGERQGWAYL